MKADPAERGQPSDPLFSRAPQLGLMDNTRYPSNTMMEHAKPEPLCGSASSTVWIRSIRDMFAIVEFGIDYGAGCHRSRLPCLSTMLRRDLRSQIPSDRGPRGPAGSISVRSSTATTSTPCKVPPSR